MARLEDLRKALENSPFFKTHEVRALGAIGVCGLQFRGFRQGGSGSMDSGGLGMRPTLLCNFGLSSVSISRAGSQNQGFSITVLSISPVLAFFSLGEWHGLLRHSLM